LSTDASGTGLVSDPDVALMLAFCQGHEDAFVELYRRHRDRIVSYCRRMLGDEARAEEAAQDVFLKIYRARGSYEPRSRFSTFLYRVATNHCLNLHARLDQRLTDRSARGERQHGTPADQHQELTRKQLRAELDRALGKLPERQRAALLLVHYEGLSYREACETIEVTEAAMKSLIHRARTTLMTELAALRGDAEEAPHAV
jgi:RNA polymerase sigma-70 factor (ECF subfamily)